ncbi:hypothetical protein BH24ACT26_BH24ACT26_01410 [soil metagenome]
MVSPARRRRRPSGEPPPLPRELQKSGRYWLALVGAVVVAWIIFFAVGRRAAVWVTELDVGLLSWLERLRTDALTRVMLALHALGSDWTIRVLRWSTLIALVAFKRFRHLFVLLGSVIAVGWLTTTLNFVMSRPRPLGIEILGHWDGFSQPSKPVAALAVTLVAMIYSLVVPGRPRSRAKWAIAAVIGALCVARLYLGVDHPTDVIVSVILGVSVPLIAFRALTPNAVFPVVYSRGRSAHLDIRGRRSEAIKRALEDQLGLTMSELKPFGLHGSGGSTPLLLCVSGDPDTYLFGKLYAATHLRSDRWYKLGRTLLYGRLEDERSFSTVRRLVQYEDYMLRVMRDGGLPTAEPYGFVEITPEREYLIVTEFIEGAQELLEAEVDDAVIDDALLVVRTLWDAGLAHRDIKPSNVIVRNSKVYLIDLAFGEVRPSPWRQAVDLANMMLVLALRADADRVYERACQFFTPEEIAEGFAATHGVTMPSQSRDLLRKEKKRARRDLVARFRELSPKHPNISIQSWSWRRVGLTIGVFLIALILFFVGLGNLEGVGLL